MKGPSYSRGSPPNYEGILAVNPGSAKSGTRENLTLTYTLGHDFREGWIEFTLPEEITATPGQDKIVIGGEERLLTETEISEAGQKVLLTDISGNKGEQVVLTLVDKAIPAPGPCFFKARADADGQGTAKPATLGTGREFAAFLAYAETDAGDVVKGFIRALKEKDVEGLKDYLAEDVVYVDHCQEGYFDLYQSKEEVAEEIAYLVEEVYDLVYDEQTFQATGENIWSVRGKANDRITRLVAALNPAAGFTGFGYTAKFFVNGKKISYIEFLYHRDDEDLFAKLTGGSVGVLIKVEKDGPVVVRACVPGMPAAKAGLRPGDIIVAIDGVMVEELRVQDYGAADISYRLLGQAGTPVTVTINRNGEIFDVEMVRTGN